MDSIPELPGLWSLTPWGALLGTLVTIATVLIRGTFIPKSSHERELKLVQDSRDEWKDTAKELQNVNTEIRSQNTKLVEANEAATSFFKSVTPHRNPFKVDPFEGGEDV